MRRLFEGGTYSSNYCNWQLKSLLHLGQIVITFRTLLHLGENIITFRTLLHLGSFQLHLGLLHVSNRLKALQLQEQVFLNKRNFRSAQRLFSVKYLFGELHILLRIFFYFRAAKN